MKCPRTESNLKQIKVGGIAVDISQACGGVFFDNHELAHFDEQHEKRGTVLIDHLAQFSPPALDYSKRINCPKCTDIVMARQFYSPKHQIEIDICPGCGGIWFDYGELAKLRGLFPHQSDREQAGKDFEKNMLEDPMYQAYFTQIEQKQSLAKKLNRFSQFINTRIF
ncbi:zf-TFIIB domain-containing protein [Shewanella sp. 10N.286.48.B5]|uniref:TFIIB-type zinc ribbon-containing protein n=1 Tax=Shewanella sp. 10N.286.48.B5 TaxID=1880834 RepID=UPI000CB732A6|nr:zf-TFIIB domain-containing protein [Shewanella sp. 10N.286.48.B5]PMH89269.1 hypothetical protein BCU57_03035 [Shewanella sp. 10N.286.48.B5]